LRTCTRLASERGSDRQLRRAFIVEEDEAVLDAFAPSVDFIAAPGHADATPTAMTDNDTVNAKTAETCSNRLDIGSPPFEEHGTCRGLKVAEGGPVIKLTCA